MKSQTPHDPLDELLAAAVLGELTPEELAQLETRLQNDPAAFAAYQETRRMHDLLEKNYREAQPDPAFEERMISGVRRKVEAQKTQRETAWESVLVLWRMVKRPFGMRPAWTFAAACGVLMLCLFMLGQTGESRSAARQSAMFAINQHAPDMVPTKKQAQADRETYLEDRLKLKDSQQLAQVQAATPAPASVPPQSADTSTMVAENAVTDGGSNSAIKAISSDAAGSLPGGTAGSSSAPRAAPALPDNSAPVVTSPASAADEPDMMTTRASAPLNKPAATSPVNSAAQEPSRKLVRNAQLDLEVKSFQATVDAITAAVNGQGGYVDSSNSQRGGNGKLQGSVVVKVLPQNLDAFLLKLRGLGEVKNQSVSTEDVTKDYYDTQARLENSRRMETQLQELLKHDNGKVSELLQVERELGRVRGDIEQMQGQLKLYDFQVQYATVTISVQEKDLNQAAAYLLKENDNFSLFAGNVEDAFAQARRAAEACKGQILSANLNRGSGNEEDAQLSVSVPPDQIDGFLDRIRGLGRVDNFTRQTQRVARDGGETEQPADETKTEKDRVQVQVAIRADDETARQETQLAVVSTGDIDRQAQQIKAEAAKESVETTSSSFERATDGTETAQMTFRLPLEKVPVFMVQLQRLGRTESLTVQRTDRPGEASADPNAPAEIGLRLHNDPAIVGEDKGFWVTFRQTFSGAIAAFLGSVEAVGILLAWALPWLLALAALAWSARRLYVARRR